MKLKKKWVSNASGKVTEFGLKSHVSTWSGVSLGKCSKLTIAAVKRANNVL